MNKYPLYRDNLNPKLWHMDEDGHRLDNKVRKMLLRVAADFVKNLREDNELNIKIHDVIIIGSVANYNWTNYSDIDLHIVIDFNDLDMSKDDAQTMFDAIKTSWNSKHDIKMKGHDVELYVQDIEHKPVSTAEYSLIKNNWIKEPKKEDPKFDKELIKKKYKIYKKQIADLISDQDEVKLKSLLEKLYKYRQAGLDKGGELSEENIIFKILRAKGHLDKLKDNINKIYDKKMSVKEGLFSDMVGSPDTIKYEVRSYGGGRKYTATKDGKQVASATVEDSEDGAAVLLDIWVEQSQRNLGIGKKLMGAILKKEKGTIRLEPSDQTVKDWYSRLGFVSTGEGNWMELKEEAIPNDAPPQDQVHVFDFDDTLGITDNPNGVMMFHNGQPAHKDINSASQWIKNAGLEKYLSSATGKNPIVMSPELGGAMFYVDSGGLAKIQNTKNIASVTFGGNWKSSLPAEGDAALIDFTPSSDVKMTTTKPIKPTIDKLKTLNSMGAKTAVMTARQGSGDTTGMDGKTIPVTNEKDIDTFLSAQNAKPNAGIMGVKGKDKGNEIDKKFIKPAKNNPPKEIHFYDDSGRNTKNVANALAGKVPSELYIYGPGHFDTGQADPNTPNEKYDKMDGEE